MEKQVDSDPAEGWSVFEDPERRFLLRYPAQWRVLIDNPDRTLIQEKSLSAELAIVFFDGDCATSLSALRTKRLNYYLVREFTRPIAGIETTILEFRDTISNVREFHAFLPAERRCCQLRWRRSERPEGLRLEPTLENMLFTFKFLTRKS